MKDEVVNRVAELYKRKSDILNELSILEDTENNQFKLSYSFNRVFCMYGNLSLNCFSKSFLKDMSVRAKNYLLNEIEVIDKELLYL
jgi:hypothetical protein